MLDSEEESEIVETPPLILTAQEREWLQTLPLDLALEKVKKNHFSERCVLCKRFVGNHSLRQMKNCLVKYWNEEEDRG